MEPTALDNLYAAADVSGLATNTSTILVALVGVALLFVAYRYVKKAISK